MTNIEEKPKTLEELLPTDMFIGTSLILREDEPDGSNRFLYGMRPVKEEGPRQILELTGIGGGLEAMDASPGAGAIREAQEEIACTVTLVPCSKTLLIKGYNNVSLIRVAGPEQPLAIIYRHYKSPPHSPWHPYNKGYACLVIFLGQLVGQPRPVRELPNLIWLPSSLVLETARRDVPLGELLMAGAALVPGRPGSPPLDGLARMTDSQEALALALNSDLPAFFGGLFQTDFPEQLVTLKPQENEELAGLEASGLEVAYPSKFAEVSVERPVNEQSPSAPGQAKESLAQNEQIVALQATVDQLRQEIVDTRARIEQLILRTAKVENEVGLLRKAVSHSKHKLSRLWQRRRRSGNG